MLMEPTELAADPTCHSARAASWGDHAMAIADLALVTTEAASVRI